MKTFSYNINGNDYEVKVNEVTAENISLEVNGEAYTVQLKPTATASAPSAPVSPTAKEPAPSPAPTTAPSGGGSPLIAPLPGVIVKLVVKVGDTVKKGDKVAVLEAMKMENDLKAHQSGTITAINVAEGESVAEGTAIVTIA